MTTAKPCDARMEISPGKEMRCTLPAGHEGSHKSPGWTRVEQKSKESK